MAASPEFGAIPAAAARQDQGTIAAAPRAPPGPGWESRLPRSCPADPGIERAVGHVDQDVDDTEYEPVQQRDPHDGHEIEAECRLSGVESQSGPVEDRLDQH